MRDIYYQEGNIEALYKLVAEHPDDPELYQQLSQARTEYRELYIRKAIKLADHQDFNEAIEICNLFTNDNYFDDMRREITQNDQRAKGVWQIGNSLWAWDERTKTAKQIAYYPELRYWLINPSKSRIAVYEASRGRVYVISIDGENESLIRDYSLITDNTRIASWVSDDTLRLTDGWEFKLNEYNTPAVASQWKR